MQFNIADTSCKMRRVTFKPSLNCGKVINYIFENRQLLLTSLLVGPKILKLQYDGGIWFRVWIRIIIGIILLLDIRVRLNRTLMLIWKMALPSL